MDCAMTKQNKWLALGVLLLVLAAAKVAMLGWWQSRQPENGAAAVQCDVLAAGCPFLQGATLRLRGLTSTKSAFSIEADGVPSGVQSLSASFRMDGMEMGFNRFDLAKQADGSWRAERVYLPLCTAGRHDWVVVWQADGVAFQAAFVLVPAQRAWRRRQPEKGWGGCLGRGQRGCPAAAAQTG